MSRVVKITFSDAYFRALDRVSWEDGQVRPDGTSEVQPFIRQAVKKLLNRRGITDEALAIPDHMHEWVRDDEETIVCSVCGCAVKEG